MLIRHLRRRRKDVAWLAAWSLVQSLPAVASGWSLAQASDQFLAGRAAGGLAWLGVLAVTALAGAFGTRQAYLRIGAIVEPFRDELLTAIVDGALARPDVRSVARMTHQAEIVRDSVAGVLSIACTFACTVASTLIGLVTLVPATLPYVVPPLLASVAALRLVLRPYAARQRAAVLAEESVAAEVARAASAARDITACGAEELVVGNIGRHISRQEKAGRRVANLSAARLLCLAAGAWLPLLLVLAAAPGMLRRGASPGDIVGAVTYITGSLRGALYTLSQGMGAGLVRLNVTLGRILQTSAPPGVPQKTAADLIQGQPGMLELRDVTFGYGPHAEPVISRLTLTVPPGDHLAVVGPSGIGKSSLAGLIAGMLRPDKGEVLLDGLPVTWLGSSWRILIPQEAYVFAGTLEENLTYFHPVAKAELDAAAEAVGLTPLVTRLGGYGAAVTPAALSGGEQQLIALTRAYLAPARVVILDEATCHLDPAAEERAEAAFARRGGTLIVIAHRISSARRARRVLVLDGARPQVGDHWSLLASSAMYADLAGQWDPRSPAARRSLSGTTISSVEGTQRGDGGPRKSPKDTFITIYGRMPVLEVLQDDGLQVDKLIVADNAQGESLDRILGLARRRGIPVRSAPPHRVKLLAGNGKQDQGVLADVVAPRMQTIGEFADNVPRGRCQVIVLDGVNNPQNVGMIIRTATAAGLAGVVLPRVGSPDIDPLVIKASAGVAFHASVIRCRTAADAVDELRSVGFRIYGLSGGARTTLYAERLPDRAAFVLGNETAGIAEETAQWVDRWLSIPMAGGVESLNVATAAAVVSFDLVRRAQPAAARLS